MTEEEKREAISKVLETEEGRTALAAAMAEPVRCGGMEYDNDGKAYIWLGDYAYPYEEFKKAHENNGSHYPQQWCRDYRKEHKISPLEHKIKDLDR